MTPSAITDLSITPDRGTYPPGETIRLTVAANAASAARLNLRAGIFRGPNLVERHIRAWKLCAGYNEMEFCFRPPWDHPAGYGVEVQVYADHSDQPLGACQTAFDVLPAWTAFPRYGFLCDFSPEREDIAGTIEALNRYHLNGLQFYDWQFRHDTLLPPQEAYTDPLGRPLSLKTVEKLITAAHARGMKAMPYLAIYGASAVFWKEHPEWALYDPDHHPIPFGDDFLGIMNPAAGGGWSAHLSAECQRVLERLPFDGLHIDQYGDPKAGFDWRGRPVDLPRAFVDFIRAAVSRRPDAPVLFNAVGNWPIEFLSTAPVAFNYIEIWPPKTAYTDLAEIVRNARQLSREKPVVVALYLPANRPANNRLADAMIFSAGGTRIELGENARLLSDPYFPKHEAVPPLLSEALRRQIELIIRYEDWISPLIPETDLPQIELPQGVEPFFRETASGYSLSLVNLSAEQPLRWNEEHGLPGAKRNFSLEIHIDKPVARVWLVSPDFDSLSPLPVEFKLVQDRLVLTIPSLEIWDVLLLATRRA